MLPEGIIRVTNSILIRHFVITNHKVSLLFNLKKIHQQKFCMLFPADSRDRKIFFMRDYDYNLDPQKTEKQFINSNKYIYEVKNNSTKLKKVHEVFLFLI